MNMIKTLLVASAFAMTTFGASAASITVTSDTLDSAQAEVAKKAQQTGATGYIITSARTNNNVVMTANLIK